MWLYRRGWSGECCILFFFFKDTATTEIYTLSLHDALPICDGVVDVTGLEGEPGLVDGVPRPAAGEEVAAIAPAPVGQRDRKSTRLNSSHANISYAVFCLKKKKNAAYFSS